MQKQFTISVSKGKQTETSASHNLRKTLLQKVSQKRKDEFYSKKGHTHIKRDLTYLNEDLVNNDPRKVYDELFGKAVEEYNQKQTRKDRMIGKGDAISPSEKESELKWLDAQRMLRKCTSADERKKISKLLEKHSESVNKVLFKTVLGVSERTTLREIRKKMTRVKHLPTYGEALYEKQKKSKKGATHQEFIIQVGSAEDFNEMANGKIVKSYSRTDPDGVWQKAKTVLERYYETFEKRNPNLKVLNATVHMDENAPHLHLQTVAFADTTKTTSRGKGKRRNGLKIKPSFDGALEAEGFDVTSKDSRKAFQEWQNREADAVAEIMQDFNFTRKKGVTNNIKNVHEYKRLKALEANEREKYLAQKKAHEQSLEALQIQEREAKEERDKVLKKKKEIDRREKDLDDRETDLNAKELGGKNSKGEFVVGLAKREDAVSQKESALDDREEMLDSREENLNSYENALKLTVSAFATGFCQAFTQDPTEEVTTIGEFLRIAKRGLKRPVTLAKALQKGTERAVTALKEDAFGLLEFFEDAQNSLENHKEKTGKIGNVEKGTSKENTDEFEL